MHNGLLFLAVLALAGYDIEEFYTAIGDDKTGIELIYGDSFSDITDLNRLPIKLTALAKRHIRV